MGCPIRMFDVFVLTHVKTFICFFYFMGQIQSHTGVFGITNTINLTESFTAAKRPTFLRGFNQSLCKLHRAMTGFTESTKGYGRNFRTFINIALPKLCQVCTYMGFRYINFYTKYSPKIIVNFRDWSG